MMVANGALIPYCSLKYHHSDSFNPLIPLMVVVDKTIIIP